MDGLAGTAPTGAVPLSAQHASCLTALDTYNVREASLRTLYV